MSIRRTTKARRGASAVVVAAALALTMAGCGGDDGKEPEKASSDSKAPASGDNKQEDTAAGEDVDPNAKLAVLKGEDGVEYTVTSVARDSGGFVTVTGQMENTGSDSYRGVNKWTSTETEMRGQAVSGGTLVDKTGKKRYYVLRDTDGRCLCSAGITKIEAGATVPVFMQFPAPPKETTEVDLIIPTFNVASLKISG